MPMHEILRGEWKPFFNKFIAQHEDWLVTIVVSGRHPDQDSDMEAQGLPLKDIAADLKDDEDIITITLGRVPEIRHAISGAKEVRVVSDEQGNDQGLDIVSKDGTTTTLRFRVTVIPGTLDRVMSD